MSIQAFQWYNPTKLVVKHDASSEIANYLASDQIQSVLLIFGKESAKKIGVYDQVVSALKAKNIIIYELGGVRANPEIQIVCQGIDICRQNQIQAVLPLGGGSTFDTAKGIACGALLPEEFKSERAWDIYEGKVKITKALPIYGVLTISATGSEMNSGAVAQDDKQKKKYSFHSIHNFPKVSIVDPKLQSHLPWFQQVNGFVDAFMHIAEFVTNMEDTEEAETTFALDISLLKSIIKAGNKLQLNTEDHVARANFVWAATCALNQVASIAMRGGCGATHFMEHAISAYDPSISHGAGLGVVFPAFVRANGERGLRLNTYDRMAKEIFNKAGWQGLIQGFQDQLKKWGHPTTLNELFGRQVEDNERKIIMDIYKQCPVCGHYTDFRLPDDITADTFKFM
ncbi:Alcohol_dehydrogenase [Hexamita inflata]|uniref:Alcohol dehydrogenase n=1 Tax=Hexamita inflata TaxID=28002 RepID=A0AA86TVN6_9EUKA|nr:Alcohol dehydrogenase [Hexamita inflata]